MHCHHSLYRACTLGAPPCAEHQRAFGPVGATGLSELDFLSALGCQHIGVNVHICLSMWCVHSHSC